MKTLVVSMHPTPASSKAGKKVQELFKQHYDADVHEITDVISMHHAELTAEEIKKEQNLLTGYDRIVFASPMQWMNISALGRMWIEQVFTEGFAFSFSGSSTLSTKHVMFVWTSGDVKNAFREDNYGTIEQLAYSMKAIANYTKATYDGCFNFAHDEDCDAMMAKIVAKVPK